VGVECIVMRSGEGWEIEGTGGGTRVGVLVVRETTGWCLEKVYIGWPKASGNFAVGGGKKRKLSFKESRIRKSHRT